MNRKHLADTLCDFQSFVRDLEPDELQYCIQRTVEEKMLVLQHSGRKKRWLDIGRLLRREWRRRLDT